MKIRVNKRDIINALMEITFMVISVSVIILFSYLKFDRDNVDSKTAEQGDKKVGESDTPGELNLWYNDKEYGQYFQMLAQSYEKDRGVRVNVTYIDDIDYLEDISKACINKDINCPDIYLLNTENLEAAYGYGLAKPIYSETLDNGNFASQSLRSVTYKDKYVAYPLSMDTAVMVYNKLYMPKEPQSFDDVINAAETFDYVNNSNVKQFFCYDVTDTLHNYYAFGAYIDAGGSCGDDREIFDISYEYLSHAAVYYADMRNRLGLSADMDYSNVAEKFVGGEIVCTIVTMQELNKIITNAGTNVVNYGICLIPKMNDIIATRNLGLTKSLVVNYFSEKSDMAEELAQYALMERSDLIYQNTGYLSARNIDYVNQFFFTVYAQYEASVSLPKLMFSSDYYVLMSDVVRKAAKGEDYRVVLDEIGKDYGTE